MNEEELWYPAFGLKENPFQSANFIDERGLDEDIPYIKTKAIRLITELAEGRAKKLIAGDRGVGKSTILWLTAKNIKERKKIPPEWLYVFLSPSSTVEFYNSLFDKLLPKGEHGVYDDNAIRDILDYRIKKRVWFGFGKRHLRRGGLTDTTHLFCQYPTCKRSSPRCQFPLGSQKTDDSVNTASVVRGLDGIEHYCPLKMFLIKELLRHKVAGTARTCFLIDLPDDLAKIEDFKQIVRFLQRMGGVILVGIREHSKRLQKFDMFARYSPREFPLMTNEELKELYYARIKWQQKGKGPSPFTKKALDYIIKESVRNPRTLIQTCSDILVDAKIEGIVKPITLEFVEKSHIVPHMTFDKAVEGLIAKYVDMKKAWVKVEKSVEDMYEWFNFDVKSRSLGRRLKRLMKEKGLPIDHRFNPTSEYRYTAKAEN